MVEKLREVPEAVIYYHTHHFVQEHQYLNPQPPNDFAYWTSDILDEAELGERLANINPLEFNSLQALRERLIGVIEEYLLIHPNTAEAPPGKEFQFIKGVSIVIPTGYIAHDLREFAEVLRDVSIDSLFFEFSLNPTSAWSGGETISLIGWRPL